jgi:hypothetical protein
MNMTLLEVLMRELDISIEEARELARQINEE